MKTAKSIYSDLLIVAKAVLYLAPLALTWAFIDGLLVGILPKITPIGREIWGSICTNFGIVILGSSALLILRREFRFKTTCTHEAGHIVAIHCLGIGSIDEAVARRVKLGNAGHVRCDFSKLREVSSLGFCTRLLHMYLSGWIAAEMQGEYSPQRGTDNDDKWARDLVLLIIARSTSDKDLNQLICQDRLEERIDQVIEVSRTETLEMLECHSGSITTLSRLLMEKKRLSGTTIQRILGRS